MGDKDNLAAVHPVTGEVLEDDELRAKGLSLLREGMAAAKAKGDVEKYPREDDQFLLAFLRARKYNIAKSLMVLNNFAKFWYKRRDLIDGLCADKLGKALDTKMMRFLPGHDIHGNGLQALYMGGVDFNAVNPRDNMLLAIYVLPYLFEHPELQLHGMTYVETMEGFSLFAAMGAGKALDRAEQKEMMSLATDCFPMRIRDIHVIHQPWYFTMFWKIVRPFLNKKLVKRLHLHGSNLAELHKIVPPQYLPPEFGGSLDEPFDKFFTDLREAEKKGTIGGFAIPMNVDDPTGALAAAKPAPQAVAQPAQETANGGAGLPPAPDAADAFAIGTENDL